MPRLSPEARLAIAFLAILSLFRLWFATTLDLVPDEAYYWIWSKHLDASYFSKGPAIAWTIAFGTRLFGDTVFGIRWLSVLLAAGTGWQLFLLGARLATPRIGLAAMAVAAVIPIYAVGGLLMTIDALSVFFWIWAANLFLDALEKDNWWRWALCGFAVGSGFLAKYVNLLELLGFLGYALSVPRHRARILGWRWATLLGVVIVCTLPVLWWNQRHGWITTAHLKHRGDLDAGFHLHPGQLLRFFVDQAMPVSPLLLVALIAAALATLFRRGKTEAEKYLLALFLPVFGFYFLLSFNQAAKGNWAVTSYFGAIVLAVLLWPRWARQWGWARGFWIAALALAAVETAMLHGNAVPFLKPEKDPILRLKGWPGVAAEMNTLRDRYQPDLVIANNYSNASEITFYAQQRPPAFMFRSDRIENQYSFWPGYTVQPGTTALYVSNDLDYELPESLRHDFSKIEEVGHFWREYEGKRIDEYKVWRLAN
jgi:4-amino-4-deoxy-L-arabinose transferase-like glycosyltransferase